MGNPIPFCLPLLLTLISTVPLSAQNHQVDHSEIEQKIDSVFNDFNSMDKPGAAIAVVSNDSIIFAKGYGSANLEYHIPISTSTVFHIASVSKQFTVFAILLLESEQRLDLDDDIRKYMPEVPDFGTTITLRHLATHTSGLRDQWSLLRLAGWRFDDVITKDHILKLVSLQKGLNFTPGYQFSYCNTGFTLLAEVVARVSGQSFASFAEENIFKPLKMVNTLFYDDHEKIVENRAYSYYQDPTGYKKSVLNYANVGATSLFTTVEDLSLWAINFSNPKVGNEAIIAQLNSLATLNNGKTFGGAYGQFFGQYRGLSRYYHGGRDAGYRTHLARFLDQELSVIVLSNYAGTLASQKAMQLSEIFLNQFMEEPKETLKTWSLDDYSSYVGHFFNEEDAYFIRISLKENQLTYSKDFALEQVLTPVSEHTFQTSYFGSTLTVTFDNSDGSRKISVTVDGVNPRVAYFSGNAKVSEYYEPIDYSRDQLNEFKGRYLSEELQTWYELEIENDKLVLKHIRNKDISLSPQIKDIFLSDKSFMGTVTFERDNQSVITGMRVSSERVKDLLFEKVASEENK